jgi:hypothetical protein
MGAGQSIPQSLPSIQKYRGKVVPTQLLVNEIFLWMMSQVDTNDLLKLANPKYCKDYVFLTKEALGVFMKQIQLEPKMGQKNVLFFSSVKDLTFSDEKTAEQRPTQKIYRDALCSQLAFFYVRLFQVFGALALTVIDSLPEIGARPADIRAAAILPGQVGMRPPLFGGAGALNASNAKLLDKFYDYASNYFTKAELPASDPLNEEDIYIIQPQTRGARKTFRSTDKDTLFFFPNRNNLVLLETGNHRIEVSLSIENENPKVGYILKIFNIDVDREDTQASFSIPFRFNVTDYFYENTRKNFYNVVNTIMNAVIRTGARTKTVEELLGEKKEAARPGETRVDEQGVPEGLSYLRIITYLKEKPKAYCVARAIQLLSPTLTDGAQKIYGSDICFTEAKEPYMKDSLPMYGSSITTNSAGLRYLNQLFYDILKGVSPAMSDEANLRYKEFLNIMQVIFSPQSTQKEVRKLDEIKSIGFSQCDSLPSQSKRITITNANTIRAVRKSVAELLNYQMEHTARVTTFLKKMFEIEKTGRVLSIHSNILKGGLPAVNKLADEARIMLTEYYKFCEGTYRLGALQVLSQAPLVRQG